MTPSETYLSVLSSNSLENINWNSFFFCYLFAARLDSFAPISLENWLVHFMQYSSNIGMIWAQISHGYKLSWALVEMWSYCIWFFFFSVLLWSTEIPAISYILMCWMQFSCVWKNNWGKCTLFKAQELWFIHLDIFKVLLHRRTPHWGLAVPYTLIHWFRRYHVNTQFILYIRVVSGVPSFAHRIKWIINVM